MQHCFIMLILLLPSNQQSAEPIHPRMCWLDHPSTRRVFLFSINRLVYLPSSLQMQDVVSSQYSCYHIGVVVSLIQALMMDSINQLFRSLYYYLIYRLQSHHLIVGVCPVTTIERGAPGLSQSRLRFVPLLPRSTGFGLVPSPPGGAFVIAASSDSPFQWMTTFLS